MCEDARGRSVPGSNMYVSITSTDKVYVQAALKDGGEIY